MKAWFNSIRQAVFPPVPDAIRDDFTLLTAVRLQSQSRVLMLALFLSLPTAIYASSVNAPILIQLGLPFVLGATCFGAFLSLLRDLRISTNVYRAAKLIRQATKTAIIMALVSSTWCVVSWLTAPLEARIYYPFMVTMGILATAYCLSSIRFAAFMSLAIGLLPISALLLLTGKRMDIAAGTSLLIAAAFMLRMIVQQHNQITDLLMLQSQMRNLADADPLTGLHNRRSFGMILDAEIERPGGGSKFALAVIDLDGFKAVNDRHGHGVGDQLLCEVANRLCNACEGNGVVCRLGGDEFAVLVFSGEAQEPAAIANRLLSSLVQPFTLSGHVVRVGASVGVAEWPVDGITAAELFEAADNRLYAAKADARVGKEGANLDDLTRKLTSVR